MRAAPAVGDKHGGLRVIQPSECLRDGLAGPLSPILWHPELGVGGELKRLRQYSNNRALLPVDT